MAPRIRTTCSTVTALLIAALLAVPLPAAASGGGVKMDLRVHGAYSYLAAKDVNAGSGGVYDFYKLLAEYGGYGLEGDYQALHGGYDFGVDLVFPLSPRFGVGLGLGYLRSAGKADMTLTIEDQELAVSGGPSLSAVPLRLGLFATLPISGRLSLTANAGAAVYLALRFHDNYGYEQGAIWARQEIVANRTSLSANLGAQGGLGFDYRIASRWSVFVEAQGRYARFKNFGNVTIRVASAEGGSQTREGKIYLRSQILATDPPVVFNTFVVEDTPPAPDPPDIVISEPKFDLSGFCLQAGIRIRL
jgi:hypothetical protein